MNLIHKLYQTRQLELLEKLYRIFECSAEDMPEKVVEELFTPPTEEGEEGDLLDEDLLDEEWYSEDSDNESESESESSESESESESESGSSCSDSSCSDSDSEESSYSYDEVPEPRFTETEAQGMCKTKTIHVYRNEEKVKAAIENKKPLAGIVTYEQGRFEFQVVYRKPVKRFGVRTVQFNDNSGVTFHGMWAAEIAINDECREYGAFKEIQTVAKMAAVAIPLRYVLNTKDPKSCKYCVLTNWWKYRTRKGGYELPTLNASLYGARWGAGQPPFMNQERKERKKRRHSLSTENGETPLEKDEISVRFGREHGVI